MFTVSIRDKTTNEYLYGVSILKAKSEGDAVFQAMCHLSMSAVATQDVSLLQRVSEGRWEALPAGEVSTQPRAEPHKHDHDTLTDAEVSWQFGRAHGLITV